MPERFQTSRVYREHWFGVGLDTLTGRHFLEIPVSAQIVDYLEYYTVAESWALHPDKHLDRLKHFAQECRRHEHDDLLILKPGTNRGTAI